MKFITLASIIVVIFFCVKIKSCHDSNVVAAASSAGVAVVKPTAATSDSKPESAATNEETPRPGFPSPSVAAAGIGDQLKTLAEKTKKVFAEKPPQYKGWEASEVQKTEDGRKFVRYTWAPPEGNPEAVDRLPCSSGISPFFDGSVIYDGIVKNGDKKIETQIKTSWGQFFKKDTLGIWTQIEKFEFEKIAGRFVEVRPLPAGRDFVDRSSIQFTSPLPVSDDELKGYIDMFFR